MSNLPANMMGSVEINTFLNAIFLLPATTDKGKGEPYLCTTFAQMSCSMSCSCIARVNKESHSFICQSHCYPQME